MTDARTALDRLRHVNPLRADDAIDPVELQTVVAECERRVQETSRASTKQAVTSMDRPPGKRFRPAFVVAAAFTVAIALVGAIVIFGDASQTAPTTSPPATTPAPPTSMPIAVLGNVAYVDDLVYYADDERTLETSMFFPAEGRGPWPVVVIYSEFSVNAAETYLGRRLAERGAVVFTPVWVDARPPTSTEYLTGQMWDRAACAVGFAQAAAEAVGGDPTRTVVAGDGGGEHPAAWIALGHADESVCPTPIQHELAGLAAGQTQWFFQEGQFDDAFAASETIGVDIVDRFFNPDRWQVPAEFSVVLWATAWYDGNSNTIDDPPTGDSWIWSRDPTGTLVADLATVDAFDDGLITFRDNARLMQLRMTQAGIDVTYDETTEPYFDIGPALERIWRLLSQPE